MENKVFKMDLSGRVLKIETGLLANQSSGSVTISLGDTVVFSSAMMGNARPGTDFFPLTVDFEEKYYAAGKIKGSRFMKRNEAKPSDKAILNSRLIDRPIRPLFPKGMINDVQLICSVLSADMEVDPSTLGIIAASAALSISGMPFQGPVSAVRVGLVDGQLIINPTYLQQTQGNLDLVVAGTDEAITMVEAGAKEIDDETLLKALELAHGEIKRICALQKEYAGLYPEFSKIICISITCIQLDIETNEPTFKTKVIYNSNDEKQLLTEFSNICELFTQKKGQKAILAGHNITAFDIPFICKRTIINDLKLPTLFDISGKKPWEINIIDTLNYWKFNSLDMISLDLLCYVLGIDSSKDGDVSGYNLSDMYYSDDKEKESKIKNYCKADTEAVGEILLKLSEI
jgi:ribonuclease PH